MNPIKHLDCSLRDGGYYNKWHFDDKVYGEQLKLIKNKNQNSNKEKEERERRRIESGGPSANFGVGR